MSVYLPAPIKVENNHIKKEPNLSLWAGCSVALGILSYYAPKTFLAASAGIVVYQVHHFNQLVHTDDTSKHQQIHAWAIKACMVMRSIGTVLLINSLPYFWSAAKALHHLQIAHFVGQLTKGFMIAAAFGGGFVPFSQSAENLTSSRRWVEMEDYVTNYPEEIKQKSMSSHFGKLVFYISALLPETWLARGLSKHVLTFSQFQPEGRKFSILYNYFENLYKRHLNKPHWPLAIHQFQQLSKENQLAVAHKLATAASRFSEEERNQFPDEVKVVLLNETLKGFEKVPTDQDNPKWQAFVEAFDKFSREKQESILGEELCRLIRTLPQKEINKYFSEPMRLAALKVLSLHHIHEDQMEALEEFIYNGLSGPFQAEYNSFQQNLTETATRWITPLQRNRDVK